MDTSVAGLIGAGMVASELQIERLRRENYNSRLAARNHGKLTLVKVIREFGWLKRIATPRHVEVQEQLRPMKLAELDALADTLRQDDQPVATKVLVGQSSIEIIREVLRDGHDIVIKQAKGLQGVNGFLGTTGVLMGKTAETILARIHCSVLAVKPDGFISPVKLES